MSSVKKLIAALALTGFSSALAAQSPEYSLYLDVITTSNVTSQQDVYSVVSFMNTGATDALDAFDMGDQSAIPTSLPLAFPFTVSSNSDVITQNDSRPEITSYKYIDMGFYSNDPATITFNLNLVASMTSMNTSADSMSVASSTGPGYFILERLSTGELYPLTSDDTITLNIPSNTNFAADFRLHFGPRVAKRMFPETCVGSGNGKLYLRNPLNTNWDVVLYNNSGSPEVSSHVASPDTFLYNLAAGNYYAVTRINNIMVDSSAVTIASPAPVVASFTASNYNPAAGTIVDFFNGSTGATQYLWDFGDGNQDTQTDPSHSYSVAGTYFAQVTATNDSGCTSSFSFAINVTPPPPAFNTASHANDPSNHSANSTQRTAEEQHASVVAGPKKITVSNTANMTVEVLDLSGRQIAAGNTSEASFETSVPQSGIYIVRVIAANGTVDNQKIYVTE